MTYLRVNITLFLPLWRRSNQRCAALRSSVVRWAKRSQQRYRLRGALQPLTQCCDSRLRCSGQRDRNARAHPQHCRRSQPCKTLCRFSSAKKFRRFTSCYLLGPICSGPERSCWLLGFLSQPSLAKRRRCAGLNELINRVDANGDRVSAFHSLQ
jgi:hypothetical protein